MRLWVMKTLQGMLRYLPAEQPGSRCSPPRSSASDQPLFVDLKRDNLGPSLCGFNQRLGHRCLMCTPFQNHIEQLRCVYQLWVTRMQIALAGLWQPVWMSWALLKEGVSRCTGSPEAGVDICVELISQAALMQKPFNCFQPSSTSWFPLTGPPLCFAQRCECGCLKFHPPPSPEAFHCPQSFLHQAPLARGIAGHTYHLFH